MNKQIHPAISLIVGLVLHFSYYLIGGIIGSAISVIGAIMFLFGLAGLITMAIHRRERDNTDQVIDKLNNKLTTIFESSNSTSKKRELGFQSIAGTTLTDEAKQQGVGQLQRSAQIALT